MEPGEIEQAETGNNPEYSNSSNRILARVIKEGLWNEKVTNPTRLVKIAEEERAKRHVDFDKEQALPPSEKLQEDARLQLTQGINNLIEHGVISPEMQDIASKVTTNDDVFVLKDHTEGTNFVALDIDDTVFPKTSEEHHKIVLSKSIINNKYNQLEYAAQKIGIELPKELLLDVALQSVVIHEWAHSLERAIGIDYYQKFTHDPNYNDQTDGWKAISSRHNVVWHEAKKETNAAIDPSKPKIESEVHRERFASGFEFETIKVALEKLGVPKEKAELMVDTILSERSEKLDEFKRIKTASNYPYETIAKMSEDINSVAKQNGLKNVVTTPWSGFGYDAPYSSSELKSMLEKSMEMLESADKRKSILEEEKRMGGEEKTRI